MSDTTTRGFYGYCLLMLNRGFDNEHALAAWLKPRKARIDRLPKPMKRAVEAAIVQCGPKGLKSLPRARRSWLPNPPG